MIQEALSLSAAFMLGILGSSHCLGMCGGIMSALSMSYQKEGSRSVLTILLSYNFGRISSYMVAGLIAGLFGLWLQQLHTDVGLILRVISAVLIILMGFYLTGWWMALTALETVGGKVWKLIQPLGNRLMPVKSPAQAFLLGCLWGWLPCGLVYSVLAWAATSADLLTSLGVMLFFGLGTLPAILMTGLFAKQFEAMARKQGIRIFSGLLIIIFGVWTLYGALMHMSGGEHSHHQMNGDEMKQEMPLLEDTSGKAAEGGHAHHH